MALRSQVVQLVRLHLFDHPDQAGRVGQVRVVQLKARARFVGIVNEMFDPAGIEHRCAAPYAVHLVALVEQKTWPGTRHPARLTPVINATFCSLA